MSRDASTADGAVAVTPSDSTVFGPCRALYIGGAGDVAIVPKGGSTAVTFVGMSAGTILPVRAIQVMATDTTATFIVALY